jgi:hypothetical protein
MTAVHAVKKQPSSAASSVRSGFQGAVLKSVTLGGVGAKQVSLSAPLKATVDRLAGADRSTWFMSDWLTAGSFKLDPKELTKALSKPSSAKLLLGDAMMKTNDTTAADEGLDDTSLKAQAIKPGAIFSAFLKDSVQTNFTGSGYTPQDIAKWQPDIAKYKNDLRSAIGQLAHGMQKVFLVTEDNGDDTYYQGYVAVNAKSGEVRVLENGTTG